MGSAFVNARSTTGAFAVAEGWKLMLPASLASPISLSFAPGITWTGLRSLCCRPFHLRPPSRSAVLADCGRRHHHQCLHCF